jgi:hypothetical protein
MLTNRQIISNYFDQVIEGVRRDSRDKNQKAPINSFRKEVDDEGGRLFGADYFQYVIFGRGPGKQPPPDKMLEFVKKNPQILEAARLRFKYITEKSLAFLIGRKIGREGTRIFRGEKQGIAWERIIKDPLQELYRDILRTSQVEITNLIKNKWQSQ